VVLRRVFQCASATGKTSLLDQSRDRCTFLRKHGIRVSNADPGCSSHDFRVKSRVEEPRFHCSAKVQQCKRPSGRKDANDVLLMHGADVLRECIDHAGPYPIIGLHSVIDFTDETIALFTGVDGSPGSRPVGNRSTHS